MLLVRGGEPVGVEFGLRVRQQPGQLVGPQSGCPLAEVTLGGIPARGIDAERQLVEQSDDRRRRRHRQSARRHSRRHVRVRGGSRLAADTGARRRALAHLHDLIASPTLAPVVAWISATGRKPCFLARESPPSRGRD
jgi:hypothetical protein